MRNKKLSIKKHPAAVARDKWLLSLEGVRCSAPTLSLSGGAYYLENRLELAFMAGWNAAEKNLMSAKMSNNHKKRDEK